MNEPFDLPVTYKGEELLLPAQLQHLGYTHKFKVEINGIPVLYEPDEERAYRALIDPAQVESSHLDKDLLKAIADTLEELFK